MVMTSWPQEPAAWRVAQACEDNMRRFERAMDDLMTSPGVTVEEAREAAAGLLRMAEAELGVGTDG